MAKENKGKNKKNALKRRDFIKLGTTAAIGLSVSGFSFQNDIKLKIKNLPTKPHLPKLPPLEKVRIGFVGVGSQGSWHVKNFLKMDKVEIKAVCDIIPGKVERIQKWVTDAGFPKPTGYSKGEYDFVRMCETEDLDLVFTATPWEWHVPVCVTAMKNGKHAATEVPAAVTIDEAWQLVENAEKYNRHCVMMENCNYSERALMVLNMIRKGIFGEIINGVGGYLHDLRNHKLGGACENDWRIKHSIKRNGNLYPTHGLGPIANAMNINRGDRFDYLVSMSSVSRGLHEYAVQYLGPDHYYSKVKYALGDVNISLIKTVNGMTITLFHDTNLPRPYDRIDLIQGTKAISIGYPDRIHIEGLSPAHEWEPLEKYKDKFQHDLWKNIGKLAKGANHGGMDFLEDYRLVQALLTGTPTDMDVYDAAALSAVSELSEISVANRSQPVDFPDFTRGLWKKRKPLIIPGK